MENYKDKYKKQQKRMKIMLKIIGNHKQDLNDPKFHVRSKRKKHGFKTYLNS